MKLKRLKRTYRKRVILLNRYVSHKDLINNLEQVHQFRVAYKKLRAVVRLIRLEQSSTKNPLKKIKKLYQKLGDIRSLQILYQHIEKFYKQTDPESREYLIKLSKRILREKRNYNILEEQISLSKLYSDLEKYPLVKLHNKLIGNYTATQIEALKAHLTHPSDKSIHSIRKILKDFQYHAKLLLPIKEIEISMLDVKKLKRITDFLGNYNDLRTSRQYLTTLSYKIPLDEQKVIRKLKLNWLDKKRLKKRKILTGLRFFVSSNLPPL